MSQGDFRKKIDTLRNILVGAAPAPAEQINQITYALMYKFMNDIDDQSAAMGGKRAYFSDEYAKYNWHELMSPQLGAHDRLALYRDAIQTMAKNENIPQLFRDIFQNAFLPFNSPSVLNLFLKEVNDGFTHGESDDIGDAYEYLLSITGAQGDVGQFRTPRHIIKFIVEAVNPTKNDKVLDPAVGTAGFLIAAYNHVRAQHDSRDEQGNSNDEKRLTASDLDKIHSNYHGFDVDPTMVRTAKVNLYLHGFTASNTILNHDTLSSEDYWNDRYDVILANPPFMTPKGGIQPHKKFSITANRAEVLFVDYIASHLKPNGRAGIVVPEGIIFQSGKAYQELRKNLVENYLYAVISLPAGVFQPYSGVKTSVLLLDKELARQKDEILFVKIENDGFGLGAQRKPIAGEQLTEAMRYLHLFKNGVLTHDERGHAVARQLIAESGDYNLSGDRYKTNHPLEHKDWPMTELGDVLDYEQPTKYIVESTNYDDSYETPVLTAGKSFILGYTNDKTGIFDSSRLPVIIFDDFTTATKFVDFSFKVKSSAMKILHPRQNADIRYVYYVMQRLSFKPVEHKRFWISEYSKFQIPLPPIETQREIVAELDGYQKIIDAAQTIVQTYKPTIKISPEWEVIPIGDIAQVISGQSPDGKYYNNTGEGVPFYQGKTEFTNKYLGKPKKWTTFTTKAAVKNDILMSVRAPVGPVNIATETICIGRGLAAIRTKSSDSLDQGYLYEAIRSHESDFKAKSAGSTFESINRKDIEEVKIPLPPIETQREIVAELEAEQQLINANKKLIEIYQQKIKSKIAEVWGE